MRIEVLAFTRERDADSSLTGFLRARFAGHWRPFPVEEFPILDCPAPGVKLLFREIPEKASPGWPRMAP